MAPGAVGASLSRHSTRPHSRRGTDRAPNGCPPHDVSASGLPPAPTVASRHRQHRCLWASPTPRCVPLSQVAIATTQHARVHHAKNVTESLGAARGPWRSSPATPPAMLVRMDGMDEDLREFAICNAMLAGGGKPPNWQREEKRSVVMFGRATCPNFK